MIRSHSSSGLLTSGSRRPLPPDLLRQASSRLAIVALMGAALWAVGGFREDLFHLGRD